MLSVIIIAKNEASNIRRCLDSITWADEIIILDSGSEDDTVAIAREYTPHVYQTDWQGFGVQKQRALHYASKDWVLNLDADEYVDDTLRDHIIKVMAQNKHEGYRIPIQMCFYGKPLRFSSSPSRHIRLFKREGATYSTDYVHEKILLPLGARIGRINASIWHHSFRDMSHALSKLNLYSSYSAAIRNQDNQRPSLGKTIGSSCWMFFRCYILQGGFLDGIPGLVFALFHAQGSWYRGIKQIYRDQQSETDK
ncbi:MAG TPA: glycosyltransferase family 2 protein [Legionellaceae bacterium]|nr:glycosyltransferase family 2 protein [Legionellaceae bacterium]